MKTTVACGLDCVKQLLTNIGSSGLTAAAATIATPAVVAALGAAVPLSVGAICVLAYLGVSHRQQKKAQVGQAQAEAAMQKLRNYASGTQSEVEALRDELATLGFDLSQDHNVVRGELEAIRARLEEIDRLAPLAGKRDDEIVAFLEREQGLLVSLGVFMEKNFDSLRELGVRTEATVVEIKQSFIDLGAEVRAIKVVVEGTAERVEDVLATQSAHGSMLAEILEHARHEKSSRDETEKLIRVQIEREYADKLASEQNAREAAERAAAAVMDVKDVAGIETALREKGGAAIVEALLAKVAQPQVAVVETHRKIAEWAYLVGEIDQAEASLGIILAAQPRDLDAVNRMGHIHRLRGRLAEAEAAYKRLLEIAPDDEGYRAVSYSNLALVYRRRGDLDGAEAMHKKSMEINGRLGWLEGVAAAYCGLGLVYTTRGDLEGAEAMHRKALEIDEKLGRIECMASRYGGLGLIYMTRGDLDGAEAMYTRALAIDRKFGRLEGIAIHYGNLGLVCLTRGDLDGAEAMHQKALATEEKLGRLEGIASQYANLGLVYWARGDNDGAEAIHRKCLDIDEKLDHLEGMANHYGNLGLVYWKRGDFDGAEAMYRKSLEINQKLGRMEGAANQYCGLGSVYLSRGDLEGAEEFYRESLVMNEKLGRREGMAISYCNLGLVYEMRGDVAKAREYWEKAVGLYRRMGVPHMVERVQGWIDGLGKQGLGIRDRG